MKLCVVYMRGPSWPPVLFTGRQSLKIAVCCPKSRASCAIAIGHRHNFFVGPVSVYGGLLNADKNGRLNGTRNLLWHAEY